MATKESGEISGSKYNLGDYKFELVQEPVSGSTSIKYTAVCRHAGKAARKSIIVPGKFISWYVDANDTTADVYVVLKEPSSKVQDVNLSEVSSMYYSYGPAMDKYWPNIAVWADFKARVYFSGLDAQTSSPITLSYYAAKDIYYGNIDLNGKNPSPIYGPATLDYLTLLPQGHASDYGEEKSYLVGRFPIELKDAGGVGPGSDWTDPGDYDEDRDPEDPTTTLYLTVTGALSGRHNDPLHDTSYSYTPADKATVKDYGCGGDGGNGGGGGAGAANVVVFKFATNEADHKDITTIAKRHGYGSGGGKGGKGGDGCILIYY